MYIREYMHTKVVTVGEDTMLSEAQQLMKEHGIRRLPVVHRGKLVGLVTHMRPALSAPTA